MPKGHTTTNAQKKRTAKLEGRERKMRRANNVLTKNTSLEERARLRGESTEQATKPNPLMEAVRKMKGDA